MRIATVLLMTWGAASPLLAQEVQPTGQTVNLSINDAVARALETSPKVKAAQHDRDGQIERRRGAWSDVGPRVKAEYNQVRFEEAQKVNFGGNEIVLRPEETKTGSITIAQPITGAFALVDRARMEGTQEDVKDWALTLARSDTAFQTAEAWLQAYLSKKQLEIALASVAAAESQGRDASALERAGRLNHGDVLKLDLAVSEAKARAAQARAYNEVVRAALKEAVGLPQEAAVELTGELPAVADGDMDPTAAFKQAKERRLELKMAEGGVTAAGFGKKLAYSNFSPAVNLFVKWDKNFGEPAGLGSSDKDTTRTYGVAATWELWNNGAHIFKVREAAEGVYTAEEGVRGADIKVRLDVQTAIANLRAARESLALAKVAVSQAEEGYRIEQARFRTGSRSATDTILAETSNASAKGRLVLAQTDLITWSMRLKKALGDEQPKL